ncbi:MAG TPA: hypothetical protein VFF24_15110 [Acidimicrobiia bacterium]|nr:hypothetical protein [Acidimicrobiia bacterium]
MLRTMITFSLGMSVLAGICAFVIAYERVARTHSPRDARRYALRAVPGPFLFFTGLGITLGYAVPTLLRP